jgi:hypothetical protein
VLINVRKLGLWGKTQVNLLVKFSRKYLAWYLKMDVGGGGGGAKTLKYVSFIINMT